MLVLSRKQDERIVIDNNIVVTVVSVKGGRVKLAIDAPQEVPIRRGELAEWSGEAESQPTVLRLAVPKSMAG